ncbi:flagellar filament capping protein FliD [Tepidibacter formicigenes]|nr:flagellar filament capping protein FliD [Tepidibacter formicigenes]
MSNIMRISGMATGMDTETMIKQLMDAEKIRLTKYEQQKQIKLWTQESYNNINKDIANFILDTKKDLEINSVGTLSSASWMKKATASDTSIADVIATSSSVTGTHTINITQLAEGVNKASQSELGVTNGTLDELGVAADGSITFEIDVDGTTKTVNVSYKSTDSLSDLANAINNATTVDGDSLGLQASYDSTAKRFFLSTKSTGVSAQIKITSDTGGIFTGVSSKLDTDLTLYNSGDPINAIDQGKDAIINFDGANGITYSSNNFTINGISITAKSTGNATIQIDTDVNEVYDKIKGFIDKYNELIDKLNKKIGEKRYRDYKPLTQEQKDAMDEDTIKLWEEKAKSGLLRNDEVITKILSTTRSGLYEPVYNDYSAGDSGKLSGYSFLTEIGITTGEYQSKGKLEIDETKLKDAITNDVDGVLDLLFKQADDTATDEEKRAESGLITRLYDDFISGMEDIIDKSGTGDNSDLYRDVKTNILMDFVTGNNLTGTGSLSLIDKGILDIEKKISNENDRLNRIEDRYWRQFTALEKAMSKMNSQSSWLMSQMGMGM